MPVYTDDRGRIVVTTHPATTGLAGRTYRRREAQHDPGDVVRVTGHVDVGGVGMGEVIELVVEPADFGACPPGEPWNGAASTTFGIDAFAEEYTRMTGAELAVLAIEQVADAQTATAAGAGRESPWGRS